nr:SMC5-SMC6 complex localization factor protein 2 [Pogona vitticeps]
MTQYLGSSNGGGGGGGAGDGSAPFSPSAGTPSRQRQSVPRGDRGRDGRNHCITDFFKPAINPDRTVLRSPEKGNGKTGPPVSSTEHFGKSVSSPKRSRRKKLPLPPSDRSPIIDAFFKSAKSEKKDSPDNGVHISVKSAYPKIVVRKLFIPASSSDCSLILKDSACTKTLERNEKHPVQTRTPLVDISRECKMDLVDSDSAGSGLSKWTSVSENDSLEKESLTTWCQKTACSKTLQYGLVSSSSQRSLETVYGEIQVKKKKMQSQQQSSGLLKKSLQTILPTQETRNLLMKRSHLTSSDCSSDESSADQSSEPALSSGWTSDKIITKKKGCSCPSVHPDSTTPLVISKHKECAGKRKRNVLESSMKSSQKHNVQRLDKYNFSNSLEKHDSDYSKDRVSPDGQLESMALSDSDSLVSLECLTAEENGKNYNCTVNKNDQIQTENIKGSQLQTFRPHFNLEKLASLSQEVGAKAFCKEFATPQSSSLFSKHSKDIVSHTQSNNLFEALQMKGHNRSPHFCMSGKFTLSASEGSLLKGEPEQIWKNASTFLSKNNIEQFISPLTDSDNVLLSEHNDHVTIPSSSRDLNKVHNEDSNPNVCILNKVKSLSFVEDKTSSDSLDSSDEEELLPLEKILAQSCKPSPKSPEQMNCEDDTTDSHNVPLSKPFETQFSYMNHLEHLLKEKEEFKRVDELEQQLLQIKQAIEINSVPEEEDSYDGELSAEHRAFIEKFSVIGDAIPDQHPGENIFQIPHAGKIFSQHNLDLRNSVFQPQNPIEKYLLGCGITQQLFVISEGLLMSAYHNFPCPVPILKWMFQIMTIHPDSSVSRKILNMLMTLTIKTASAADGEPKPWIPSLFDLATVLINMGVPFSALFPLRHFQPAFTENDIMCEVRVKQQSSGNITGSSVPFFLLINTSLCNMAKFLRLCISINPEGYTEKEILLLLLLLFKLSLETQLKQFPLVDLQCLIIKLLEIIREWDAKMSELCLSISCLSSHHHDLLWLVQFVPNWISRGKQLRKHLSLVIISKLLKNDVNIPSKHDEQMSLLCEDLVKMKPSSLLKSLSETREQNDGHSKEPSLSELEPQAYYLTYVLLHLVREASNSDISNPSQKKWLLKLCSTLEKHVKCDIREDPRLFYRTKVKDLVARTYSKWQQMIHSSQLTQGKIHEFWDPDC